MAPWDVAGLEVDDVDERRRVDAEVELPVGGQEQHVLVAAVTLTACLLKLNDVSTFIYFQF